MFRRTLLLTCLVLGLACSASADLILHWTLDETSGTVAKDSSGNGNDGVVGGTANWVAGNNRGALDFDASSTYIEQSDALVTGNCTIALWMMPRDLPYGSDYRSIMHGDVWEAGCIHGHLRANTSFINFEPNGGGAVSSTTECVSDEWYHAVAAFDVDTGEGKLYVNGVLEHTSSGVSSSLYIGALNFGSWTRTRRFFDGPMDDIRIYDHAVTAEEVPAIMAGIGVEMAAEPSPEDEQVDVIRDATLTWEPGELAGTHNVYVGTSFEDVNAATVPTASDLSENSFATDRLEFGQTYYWRVDEVNGTPDKTVFKGDVWSFTTEPYSIQIPGAEIAVTASSFSNEFSLPEKLIDGSGLAEDGTHGITPVSMWFTATVDLDP
ncbi:MAG: LamG domain-containing protein, partial [Planctomycetes bacterium]|nr:LamG domain-containing protein [Planctomycetota bacterium]